MTPDVVGIKEAAAILKVEVPRISRYRTAGRMPPPVAELRATDVWRRADIEKLRDEGEWSGRAPRPLSLIGTAEAAALLGKDKSQIGRWRRAGRFPEPCIELAAGPLWWQRDVERFASRELAAAA